MHSGPTLKGDAALAEEPEYIPEPLPEPPLKVIDEMLSKPPLGFRIVELASPT